MTIGFEWIRCLGSGYFGEVWLAIEQGLNAERAVKLINPDKVLDPDNFFSEAQTLQAARHPNIVRVEGTDILPDGRVAVSMEYLPKGSLEVESEGKGLPLPRAKQVTIDVLRGLHHAHSKGILHRDIKPGNILLGDAGEAKLSDFGLAILGKHMNAPGLRTYVYPRHLAPEVIAGEQFSVASDIYACGVTLYRLVNGDAFLPELEEDELFAKALSGRFPNRSKYQAYVPVSLKRVINKAMNIDPAERYQTAEQMRYALEQVNLRLSWTEGHTSNGLIWTSESSDHCYEVTYGHSKNETWTVDVRKGRSRLSLRKLSALCRSNLKSKDALRHAETVLQRFVVGKLT